MIKIYKIEWKLEQKFIPRYNYQSDPTPTGCFLLKIFSKAAGFNIIKPIIVPESDVVVKEEHPYKFDISNN